MKSNKNNEIIWILPLLLIFLILIMIKTCNPKIKDKYIIEKTKRETLEIFVQMNGKVEAKDVMFIGLKNQLEIDKIYFKEGEKIKKGDIIIKYSDYKGKNRGTKLDEYKQLLAIKNSQLRYLKEQYTLGINVLNDINKITGEIKALESEFNILSNKNHLIKRVIMSPIDGYIVKINITDNPMLVLAKTKDIKIVSNPISIDKLKYVNVGNKANIIQSEKSDKSMDAVLYKINNTNVEELKVLEFLMSSFKEITLKQSVKIKLIYQKKENIITVPISAVVKNGKNKYVIYVVDKEDKVSEKEIQIGINNGEQIEIYGNGIKEGIELIVNPNDKLKNNVVIRRDNKINKNKSEKIIIVNDKQQEFEIINKVEYIEDNKNIAIKPKLDSKLEKESKSKIEVKNYEVETNPNELYWPTLSTEIINKDSDGINIKSIEGSAVSSSINGVVKNIEKMQNNKNKIEIQRSDGITVIYSNIGKINVKKDDRVIEGDKVGDTSNLDLRYEIMLNKEHIDPMKFNYK